MGRSKQSARKFDGFTPVSQATCSSSTQFRNYMSSQQAAGSPRLPTPAGWNAPMNFSAHVNESASSKIFVNYENTFSNFQFHRPTTSEEFQPVAKLGKVKNFSSNSQDAALFMRLDFLSSFDGRADLLSQSRPDLDAVFVLDVSGSMQKPFPDDSDGRSKLEVAKDGMRSIFSKLKPTDRVALITFNTQANTIKPLTAFSQQFHEELEASMEGIRAGGGTNLNLGLIRGFDALSPVVSTLIDAWANLMPTPKPSSSSPARIRRVFFLTDMESSQADELEVISTAQRHASLAERASYFTVVGVGVDLSVSTVERISSVPGSRYISVVNAREVQASLVRDFDYDLAPIAFDIRVELIGNSNLTISKCYGSSELHSLPAGITHFTISSEFPLPLSTNIPETGLGGLYLFQLQPSTAANSANTADKTLSLNITWKDRHGQTHSHVTPLTAQLQPLLSETLSPAADLPTSTSTSTTGGDSNSMGKVVSEQGLSVEVDNASFGCDIGLRKACALVRYVDTLTAYVTNMSVPPIPTAYSHAFPQQQQQQQQMKFQNLPWQSNQQQQPSFPPLPLPLKQRSFQQSLRPWHQQQSLSTAYATAPPVQAQTMGSSSFGIPAAVPSHISDERFQIDAIMRAHQEDSSDTWLHSLTVPSYVTSRIQTVYRFRILRVYLLSEMTICGDASLTAVSGEDYNNHNILQTIDQIIRLEEQDLTQAIHAWNPPAKLPVAEAAVVPVAVAEAVAAPSAESATSAATATAATAEDSDSTAEVAGRLAAVAVSASSFFR